MCWVHLGSQMRAQGCTNISWVINLFFDAIIHDIYDGRVLNYLEIRQKFYAELALVRSQRNYDKYYTFIKRSWQFCVWLD